MRKKSTGNPISLFAFQDIITAVIGIILLLVLLMCLCLVQLPEPVGQGNLADALESANLELGELNKELEKIRSEAPNNASELMLLSETEIENRINANKENLKNLKNEKTNLETEIKTSTTSIENLKTALEEKKPDQLELQRLTNRLNRVQKELQSIKDNNQRFFNFNSSSQLPWIIDLRADMYLIARANSKAKPTVFQQTNHLSRANRLLEWIKAQGIEMEYFLLVARDKTVDGFGRIEKELQKSGANLGVDLVAHDVKILNELMNDQK